MSDYRFPKSERLARKKLWEAVFRRGSRLKSWPLALYYLRADLPEAVPLQAGFAVPSKTIRKAADRNRLKRLMREAYRLQKPGAFNNIEGGYAFVFLYLGREIADFSEVSHAVKTLLNKFKTHENIAEA